MIYNRLCPLDHVSRSEETAWLYEYILSDTYSCNLLSSLILALFISASPRPCNDLICFNRCHPSIHMSSLGSAVEGDTQASLPSYRVEI